MVSIKYRHFIIVMLLVLLASKAGSAQGWSWTVETVDKLGSYSSLASDHDGNLHLSYLSGDHLKYGFRSASTGHWYDIVVDSANGFTHISLDPQSRAHICYTVYGHLKYAAWNGERWLLEEINPGSGVIAYTCSLAIAPDGTPNLLWYQVSDRNGSDYLKLKHAVLTGGAWRARTVDFGGETGKWNSMTIAEDGKPRISYSAFNEGAMRYAKWNGNAWEVSTVEARSFGRNGSYHPGLGSCLVLDANHTPHISYESDNKLKYAHQGPTSWAVETVDTVDQEGSWLEYLTSLVLDANGNPHIAYQDHGALKHAYWNGLEWQIQLLAGRGLQSARFHSMAIDQHNTIYISYEDGFDSSLKVAVGRSAPLENRAAKK